MLQKAIEAKLAQYHDFYLEKDLLTLKMIKRIEIEQDKITVEIVLSYPHLGVKESMISTLTALLLPIAEGKKIDIKLSSHILAHQVKQGIPSLPNIKNIIAVASGKGGVGKSTVAVNVALALAKEGAKVGLLDADIYGPSQPTMLGAEGEKPQLKDKLLQPIKRHGIQSMSIGYLIEQTAAMVWRGPMIGKAMQQLLHDTEWEPLDYLIVDLPPGTGDIQLTLCQKIPVTGAVIVTTPQDLALLDVRRACEMFNKLNVPLLGIIENMSSHHCTQCGHEEAVFGEGGASKLAKEYAVSVLQTLPLHREIREQTDSGCPSVIAAPDSHYAKQFYEAARKLAAFLSLQKKDFSSRFP
ncbi:MAG: iron-sulfur cluster carrier protein ApbC, partial [Gammaproteobacteria bacterium]|nr:iron-sulfur cluster carrier protein ApbC [Gammaproteobacteria bacterium]